MAAADRVVYVASGGRHVTAGMVEELLAAAARSEPSRPVQRRSAARQAERDRIAARQPVKGLVAGQGKAPAVPPPPAPRPERDARVTALELERDDLELEVESLRRLASDARRYGAALAEQLADLAPGSRALADWRGRFGP